MDVRQIIYIGGIFIAWIVLAIIFSINLHREKFGLNPIIGFTKVFGYAGAAFIWPASIVLILLYYLIKYLHKLLAKISFSKEEKIQIALGTIEEDKEE